MISIVTYRPELIFYKEIECFGTYYFTQISGDN